VDNPEKFIKNSHSSRLHTLKIQFNYSKEVLMLIV
jgi:hypothetical protein